MNIDDIKGQLAMRRIANGERELRTSTGPIEVRAIGDGRVLAGHAAVFNQETVIWDMFREVVAPGAFKKTIKRADVRHLMNHNPDVVLARTKSKTLRLSEDATGLAFEADENRNDPDWARVIAKVERGDIDQSSFAFQVRKEEWTEGSVDKDGKSCTLPLRTIKEVDLFDTSTVTFPAYEGTDSGLRALGLGALSSVLGLSEEAREVIIAHLEKRTDLTDALKEVAALLRSEQADQPEVEVSEPEQGEDDEAAAVPVVEPPAVEAEPEATTEGEPEEAAVPVTEESIEEAERKRVMAKQAVIARKLATYQKGVIPS